MKRIDEAYARCYKDVFVCKDCKSKRRVTSMKVSLGLVSCRKCKGRSLRPKRKK